MRSTRISTTTKKKYEKRNQAIKSSMDTYLKALEILAKKKQEQNDESSDDEHDEQASESPDTEKLRHQWQNSPEFKLIMSIAHNASA